MKLSNDPYHPSLGRDLKFCLKINTSRSPEDTLESGGRSVTINMRNKLNFIHYGCMGEQKLNDVLRYQKLERSIQVINAVPVLGTITSILSSIAYLIARSITQHEFHKAVFRLCAEDEEKSKALYEIGIRHADEMHKGTVTGECLKEIASVILKRKIENFLAISRRLGKIRRNQSKISPRVCRCRERDSHRSMANEYARSLDDRHHSFL